MRVDNQGSIVIGGGLSVTSAFVPVELVAGQDGRIEIGDDVWINFGTVIAARQLVKIGHGARIGQHCILSDVDIPEMALEPGWTDARPIEIGDHAWLAGRVTVRPGVKIGERAVVMAGSIVETDIPPRVMAGGIPARVLRTIGYGDVDGVGANATPSKAPAQTLRFSQTRAASPPSFFGTLISDFTIDELVDELLTPQLHPALGAKVAPFGQVTQSLLLPPSPDGSDFAVVWTRPETTVPSLARTLAFEEVDDLELLADVDAFASLVERAAPNYKFVFVPTWVLPPWKRGLGMVDARKGGVSRALSQMNLRLMDHLGKISNVFVLNAERWLEAVGPSAMSQKAWYLGKMALSRTLFAEAALDIRAAIGSLAGGPRKLLVLDLDDTLWGGIVGDVGWEGLRLGGHDGIGEAFVDFQRALKDLKRRGIVLGIVSKNEESVALEAIRSHPQMVLREEDFVGWKINWTDKARNIVDLASDLNLGLQSVVFIDDNPVERARVRDALPEVFVPDWPEEKFLYPSALGGLRCFDAPSRSREDLERTRMYAEEQKRETLRKEVGSIAEWLKSLEIRVQAEPLGPANLARATQLLNKTNQLNLSTRRMTETELLAWAREPGRAFWTVSVSDKLGDAGLTGLLGIEREGDFVKIVDYVLSCRVMGRKVEETLVHMAVTAAGEQMVKALVANYAPTAKNKPCLSFWQSSGFTNEDDRRFTWDAARPYPLPEAVALDWRK
jgi:FkbH-like protein